MDWAVLPIAAATLVWYAASVGSNVLAKVFLLQSVPGDHVRTLLFMIFVQCSVACLVCLPLLRVSEVLRSLKLRFFATTTASLLDVVGACSTNFALLLGSVSCVAVVKCFEPVVLLVIQLATGRSSVVLSTVLVPVFALCVAVAALSIGSVASLGTPALVVGGVSNLSYALRNLLSKSLLNKNSSSSKESSDVSGHSALLTPVSLLFVSNAFGVMISGAVCLFQHVSPAEAVGDIVLLLASICHALYRLSSLFVVSQVPVLTHAVLNVMKRAFIIAVSIVFFKEVLSLKRSLAFLLAVWASFEYSRALRQEPLQSIVQPRCVLLFLVAVWVLCSTFPSALSFQSVGRVQLSDEVQEAATAAVQMEIRELSPNATMTINRRLDDWSPTLLVVGAFSNGNLGDAYQSLSWHNLLRRLVPRATVLFCSCNPGVVPFLAPNQVVKSRSCFNQKQHIDLVLIGGGGLLEYSTMIHWPLANNLWKKVPHRYPHALVGIGVGPDAVPGSKLAINSAAFVGGRDKRSVSALRTLRKDSLAIPDPILSDSDLFAPVLKDLPPANSEVCWILPPRARQAQDEVLLKVLFGSVILRGEKIGNVFPKHDFSAYLSRGRHQPVNNIVTLDDFVAFISQCGVVISGRQHGLIFAARLFRSVVGLTYGGAQGRKVHAVTNELLELPHCHLSLHRNTTRKAVQTILDLCRPDVVHMKKRLSALSQQFFSGVGKQLEKFESQQRLQQRSDMG